MYFLCAETTFSKIDIRSKYWSFFDDGKESIVLYVLSQSLTKLPFTMEAD